MRALPRLPAVNSEASCCGDRSQLHPDTTTPCCPRSIIIIHYSREARGICITIIPPILIMESGVVVYIDIYSYIFPCM